MVTVDENTIVEVGKYYMVKCAIVDGHPVPVIGEEHADNKFKIKYRHIHIDGRFLGKGNPIYSVDYLGRTNYVIDVTDKQQYVFGGYIHKRMRCKRLTTGVNPPKDSKMYNDWYADYVGKSCKGKRCSHLGTKMQEVNGKLVCPLHNLQGDLQTETITPCTH